MFHTADEAEDPDRLYELYAVIVHIGGNGYHGHYVSIIKTKDRGWLLFDDEMVEPVDKHFVRNFFGDRPGMATAYLLFYQETTFERFALSRRLKAEKRSDSPRRPPTLHTRKATRQMTHPYLDRRHNRRLYYLSRINYPASSMPNGARFDAAVAGSESSLCSSDTQYSLSINTSQVKG